MKKREKVEEVTGRGKSSGVHRRGNSKIRRLEDTVKRTGKSASNLE